MIANPFVTIRLVGMRAAVRAAMKSRLLALLVALGAAAFLAATVGIVWRAAPDHSATALSSELMSPFCPGRTLAHCPSSEARALRVEIADRLERGETPEAVTADLTKRYGSGILASPPASGIGLMAWMLPGAFALATFGLVAWTVRRATARAGAGPGAFEVQEAAGDPALAERLENELEDVA
jgi:cytochrome c-type biogenesis protein CcmH/NrfF